MSRAKPQKSLKVVHLKIESGQAALQGMTLSSNHAPDVVSDWCTRVTRVTLSECKLRKQMKQLKSRT